MALQDLEKVGFQLPGTVLSINEAGIAKIIIELALQNVTFKSTLAIHVLDILSYTFWMSQLY